MIEEFIVRGSSMHTILEPQDVISIELTKDIQKEDLVVFNDTSGKNTIKKCFGEPGDLIQIRDFKIFINGNPCPLRLENESQKFCWSDWLPSSGIIQPGKFFLLGTIQSSCDSRRKGFILLDQIVGKVVSIYRHK